MNYSDFIYDFNLYLCERFGYRNCCSVMHNANGICVSVHVWKSHSTLTLLATQNYPFLLKYDCPLWLK